MSDAFSLTVSGWADGERIPSEYAFGRAGDDGPFAMSDNISPALAWTEPPEGTKSFALVCVDPNVPSSGEDVNQDGKVVPMDLPRVDFFHWLLVDIAPGTRAIARGAASKGITARGKAVGATELGICGANDYTSWFAGDADMEGEYGSYDGPCPPWNDAMEHVYRFELHALDVASLELSGPFRGADVRKAMEGHVLASATYTGTYAIYPDAKPAPERA